METKNNPEVAVVILNFNTKDLLDQLIPFVLKSTYTNMVLWVADNASSDGSLDLVKEKFPTVRTLEISENLGYAGGYNYALQQITADYYILLNSDVEVPPNWIEPLVNLAESDQTIACIQPKIKDYYKRDYFEYAGASGGYLDKYFYAFCRGRIFETLERDEGQYNDTKEVFWATGACLFVRAGHFHEVGGFDTDFFAHMEEIDMCWRLKNAGYIHYVCPQSEVYHMGGGTLASGSKRKHFLNYRNNLIMIIKNADGMLSLHLLKRMVLDGISAIVALLKGQTQVPGAVWSAHMAVWGKLGYWKAKRTKDRKAAVRLFPKSVVFQYFVRGKKKFSDL